MKLIVGLGNPGKEYEYTRHNVGFMVLDNYLGNKKFQEKFNALYFKMNLNNELVYFIKPLTYMNSSGKSVREFINYFKINLENVLIIHDELDIPFGSYKLKKDSSSGGHNGIKSIIKELSSQDFARLKIGIKANYNCSDIDFVLEKFSPSELCTLKSNMQIYCEIINSFINYGIEKTMQVYNSK